MAAVAGVVLLAACATNSPVEQGKRLIAQGDTEQGLQLLQQAAHDHPEDADARYTLAHERDLAVTRFVDQAGVARQHGQLDAAEALYRRALALHPENVRARTGLAGIAADRRHPQMLQEAETLLAKKDFAGAEAKVRAVLADDPNHAEARALLRRIADAGAGAARASALPVLTAGADKLVNLEFRDAGLKQVLEMISRTARVNFVLDRDVKPDIKVTIFAQSTTVNDVVRMVLTPNQLEGKVLNDNTLLIYPATAAKQREYQELMVRSFYIANSDVTKTLAMIKAVVKTRDTFVDEKSNLLIIRDTPDAVHLAEKLIAAQDVADPEVSLDVEVLEVSTSLLQNVGLQYPTAINFEDPVAHAANAVDQRLTRSLTAFVATPEVVLNISQQDGLTNVLANPRIRVKNREKAHIHIGDRVPVVTTTSTANVGVSSSVSYLDVGIKLDVEPVVKIENDVEIKVGLEVSSVTKQIPLTDGGIAYQVGTRNASTVLRLKDGETQVLAGLIQDDDTSTATKLPGLAELPVLGRLFFTSNNVNHAKTEVILLITPHVVRNIARPEFGVSEFLSGTDAAVGAPPFVIRPSSGMTMSTTLGSLGGAGGQPAAVGRPPTARPSALQNGPPPLAVTLNAPAQAKLGGDLSLSIAMPEDARVTGARLEILYDPAQLTPADSTAQVAQPGRLVVSTGAEAGAYNARLSIPFHVTGTQPGAVQIGVDNSEFKDANGTSLPAVQPGRVSVELTP
jgi:general secretion pathway protein D